MTRKDVIVIASVSCIYNIGSPREYEKFTEKINLGDEADWVSIGKKLIKLLYDRAEFEFKRGSFRIRGNYLDIYPAYEDFGYRLSSEKGKINKISVFEPLTGKILREIDQSNPAIVIYPAKHYLTDAETFNSIEHQIREDLKREYQEHKKQGRLIEAERLLRRVNYDLEMIKEVGYVNGIENYSRYLDGRAPGDPPYTLLDYFKHSYGSNYLTFIDESHMTVPQLRGMYNGDFARKKVLIEFGFRLNAAFDNRPLKFEEFYRIPEKIIYVSATPNQWEIDEAKERVIQQLIRPTGILDPRISIRPSSSEIPDLISEIEKRVKKKERVLVTTLTKRTAEDLSEYLKEKNINASYLHSDIQTLERSDILDNLRKNKFDVLIGVNLLREGLDLPEVTLVAILDADKEGFLRSKTALVQTMGRAARNIEGEVIIYADNVTTSIKAAVSEIERRRTYQKKYNDIHGITPTTIKKPIREKIVDQEVAEVDLTALPLLKLKTDAFTAYDKKKILKKLESEMKKQADNMNFEIAIQLRDKIKFIKQSSN